MSLFTSSIVLHLHSAEDQSDTRPDSTLMLLATFGLQNTNEYRVRSVIFQNLGIITVFKYVTQ